MTGLSGSRRFFIYFSSSSDKNVRHLWGLHTVGITGVQNSSEMQSEFVKKHSFHGSYGRHHWGSKFVRNPVRNSHSTVHPVYLLLLLLFVRNPVRIRQKNIQSTVNWGFASLGFKIHQKCSQNSSEIQSEFVRTIKIK